MRNRSTSNSINRIDKIQLRSTSPDGVKIYKYYRLESKSKSSVIEVVCDGNKLSFDDSDQESTSTIITTNTTKNNTNAIRHDTTNQPLFLIPSE